MERYVIHVTKECNCACLYCYERDKTSTYTWEEVKAVIDSIVRNNKERVFGVEFLGGEPMLAFDLIKKSYEYLESIDTINVIDYALTTNGTILTDEILEFVRNNPKTRFFASMDGTRTMNQFRVFKDSEKNTYDVVMKNMARLAAEIGTDRIGIHMVTHPYNVAYLAQGIDHLYNKGIRNFGIGTVESTMRIDSEYCKRFILELDIVSQRICEGKYPGMNIDLFNSVKPKSDIRHYVYDENGKLVAESYGRAKNDFTDSGEYNAVEVSSDYEIGEMIYTIRETVFNIHNNRLRGICYENSGLSGDHEGEVQETGCDTTA